MTAIAKEANCCTSTVSRSVLKFQAWRMFAIDVMRGRLGGISVRLRSLGDDLSCYARAAWDRLRSAAIRARINVASLINLREEGYREPEPDTEVRTSLTRSSYMDATFSEAWANAEARGAEIRAEAARAEREIAPIERARAFDPGNLTYENVVAARIRDCIFDPAGEEESLEPFKALRWYHGIR
jgi:hypothetical protein